MDLRGFLEVRDVVSPKWDVIVLMQLSEGPLRYSQLAQRVRRAANDLNDGVLNDGVLSKSLKRLQANGLIHQTVHNQSGHAWALTPRSERILVELAKISSLQLDPAAAGDAEADATG